MTVYRLSIHNSVEEKILELQEKKRKLANAAIEGGKTMGKLTMNDMMSLFKRDAEFDYRHADDASETELFSRGKVLDSQEGLSQRTDSTAYVKRKAGSLGFKRQEDSVYGRR